MCNLSCLQRKARPGQAHAIATSQPVTRVSSQPSPLHLFTEPTGTASELLPHPFAEKGSHADSHHDRSVAAWTPSHPERIIPITHTLSKLDRFCVVYQNNTSCA